MANQTKILPFVIDRDIPREIALKVARLANEERCSTGRTRFSERELAEVILVAIGAYREASGR